MHALQILEMPFLHRSAKIENVMLIHLQNARMILQYFSETMHNRLIRFASFLASHPTSLVSVSLLPTQTINRVLIWS